MVPIAPHPATPPRRRPSSERRAVNLQVLLAALGDGELDLDGITAALRCSPSAARNYIKELVDTKQIQATRVSPARGRTGCAVVYRLEPERRATIGRDPLVAALFG